MGRKAKKRRQSHGSAWHWKQTDTWYYTLPGTKKRVALFDEQGRRIRGKQNMEAAEIALAREKLTWEGEADGQPGGGGEWIVARVCSEYQQYCERGVKTGSISQGHCDNTTAWLNDLCEYCGALPVAQFKKGHVQDWIDKHESWKSPATHRSVIAIVLAAFNRADEMFGITNPIKGLKKPKSEPRLASFTPEEEQTLYAATEPCFGNFLYAALHTGLRPFCELARITANDVEESDRGMMWRVYSSKTKKTRKIPVRPEVAELTRKMESEADSRGFYHAAKKAVVSDGLPYNWTIQQRHFRDFTPILDFVHAVERLYEATRCVSDDVDSRWADYLCWSRACWGGHIDQVLVELKRRQVELGMPPQDCEKTDPRKVLAEAIGYFENNGERMKYPEYRQQGLPTTSALMESLVKEINIRVKGTEKFWNDGTSGEAILQLRAAALCDDDRLDRFLDHRPGHAFHPNVPTNKRTPALAA